MNNAKNIFAPIRTVISLLLVFTVLLGGIYPFLVTIMSKVFFGELLPITPIANKLVFHDKTSGSLITINNKVIGSSLLGQEFTEEKYFWGRLSANHYDAVNSGGSNLSPANPKLLEAVNARIEALQKSAPKNKAKIPVDLVTASASGLDPHISLSAAEYQVERVATARGMKPEEVQSIINEHVSQQSRLFGEPYINVLELNLAMDKL